ncbi:MAG: hypothetical protein U0547_09565 [Dehalococcoidia bacterium]
MPTGLAPTIAGHRRVFCCHEATLTGRHAPNSLEAVAECVAAAVPRLEVDVRFLADDGMLVFHDSWFDTATDGEGAVSTHDTAATRRIRSNRFGTTLPCSRRLSTSSVTARPSSRSTSSSCAR